MRMNQEYFKYNDTECWNSFAVFSIIGGCLEGMKKIMEGGGWC